MNRFDVVRLVAALLVLLSHSFPIGGFSASQEVGAVLGSLQLGLAGVAIFFVVSGYLVTQSLQRARHLLDFAWRRVVRIYPALLVLVALTIWGLGPWFTAVSPDTYWAHSQTQDYWLNATGWVTFYPLPLVFADNPYPHVVNGSLWSLAYELRCYVALVVVAVLPGSLRAKTQLAMALLCVAWLIRPSVPPAGPFDTHLGMDYYHVLLGIYFVSGAMFAAHDWPSRLRPAVLFALASLTLDFLGPPFSAAAALAQHLGAALLVLWIARCALWLPEIPHRMGDLSYGTYLYAFPCQQVLAAWGQQAHGFWVYTVLCLLLTLTMAALSWHLIERPALRLKRLFAAST